MLRLTAALPVLPVIWLTSSCSPSPEHAQKLSDMEARVAALETQMELVRSQHRELSTRVGNLTMPVAKPYATAILDPAEHAFERVDGTLGTFAVSIADVQPFADGIRVRLNLGNLSAVTYGGAKLTLKYGPRLPDANAPKLAERMEGWSAAVRTKEVEISDKLLPGHWNPVSILLPSIEPRSFGYLEVAIATNQIFMY